MMLALNYFRDIKLIQDINYCDKREQSQACLSYAE